MSHILTMASDLHRSGLSQTGDRASRVVAMGLGIALVASGAVSQALTFRNPRLGNPDWEVAYFGEFSATLSLVAMGMAILLVLGIAGGNRVTSFVLAVGLALLGAWALFGAVLVALDSPLVVEAARTATSLPQATGLKVVTAKAFALCAVYAVGFIGIAGFVLRTTIRKDAS